MTFDSIDTLDVLIARCAAGSLPAPAQVLVESHLALKADHRALAAGLEALAGEALDASAPIDLHGRAARLDRIFAGAPPEAAPERKPLVFPRPLFDFLGFDADRVPWKSKLPGFKEYDLGEIDGCHTQLLWLRPGRKIPDHTHDGLELVLVLDGDFTDASGHYGPGDIALSDDTVDHRPIAGTERPCICLSVVEGNLKLTGPLHRRLGDIMGF
jgi:putative transcriptional regulator